MNIEKKYIIKNATVIDGLGSEKFSADILVENGIIKEIGQLNNIDCHIIDAENNVVSPGFIDVHSHDDIVLIVYPEMDLRLCKE